MVGARNQVRTSERLELADHVVQLVTVSPSFGRWVTSTVR